ncbi:hypothetical protein AAHB34_09025 [Paenarthrobacter ureafaciens]
MRTPQARPTAKAATAATGVLPPDWITMPNVIPVSPAMLATEMSISRAMIRNTRGRTMSALAAMRATDDPRL